MNPTACILVIGNEILSGRTQDVNVQYIARRLTELGITLAEVRVIPDQRAVIVGTVCDVRARFDHIFTTGGIGPTHDDITAPCIAEAFGVPWSVHPDSFRLLEAHFPPGEFNAARQRMATLPEGATPIANPVSVAPGFSIGNVHVMAGVPRIMQAMFEELAPTLRHGTPVTSRSWYALGLYEGALAEGLADIQDRHPSVDIGSYPFRRPDGRRGVALVSKGLDAAAVCHAADRVRELIERLGFTPAEGEPP
ncbi:molybdopterin binding domain [Gluconacetobacter diazotrophicus PA1 5]|uniref:Molybdopterin binding n=2 Tax=Gluconacetobacter diazotrophicus TaxID=33996 RepID=A9HL54_GLUDA|nr:molybdopterin-binding protein [Gluconacetobacter diazotrophicus]ACI50195.1 molybdopterin binding domain [Gluconacetobacter diazotrophicus PA1 5]MBB2154885.1 competence/damage-inducible protein A [Gluconacetobacter diazotrophicus]TWB08049.1 molybdenum cofactor synthesis domain-containing protein [Gluconacetobacter diazotrophicus]CAP56123.1 Molybdopterin binding [Gluconacetobacter diazotrophicus PA1 5]